MTANIMDVINHETEISEQWQIDSDKQSLFKIEIERIMAGERALSFSSIKAFLQSPKHFFRYKTEKKTTDAMNEGIAFHKSVLEPERFKQEYFVIDDSKIIAEIGGANPRSTNKYKEWKNAEIAKNEGKTLLSKEDYDTYHSMGKYLRQCSSTRDLIGGLTETEKPFEFEYEDYIISGKIDGLGDDYILDLKKVSDASYQKIKWIIRDMLYDMQGGIYSYAGKKRKYFLIFIDSSCNVTVVKLSAETLSGGMLKFDSAINEFRRCVEEDLFNSSYEFWNGGFIET